ncbi:MAG: hypothetical protein O7G87_03930 [bacterium]|nr:hypothetical protein [bacterium]
MLKLLDNRAPVATTKPSTRSQPLGALLIFKRDEPETHPTGNLDFTNPKTLKDWEKCLGEKIYKIYGIKKPEEEAWQYFSLLEFADLEAWQQFQTQLDQAGFSDCFIWEIVALGRRIG